MYSFKRTFVVLLALVALYSCGSDKSASLCRTWQIEDLKYTSEIPPELKPQIDNWLKEMKTAFSITYKKDGTYTTLFKEQELDGKWKLNWNSSSITATAHDGTIKTFHVKELTDTKFTFEAEESGEKVIFFMIPSTTKSK